MTDDELIDRIRAHDCAALAGFIDRRRAQLLGFIERQLGAHLRRKLEPDDILQDVSVEAVRALPAMDLTDRDPFGWLCQLAERRIIDAHRRLFGAAKRDAAREVPIVQSDDSTRQAGLVNLLIATMTTASQMVSRDERHQKLAGALAELPADQREALRLRYVENLPSKDIAERLGKSDGAVRVMLTRSLQSLAKLLGPEAAP